MPFRRFSWISVCLLAGSVFGPGRAAAQIISVSGSPGTMTITTAVTGNAPTSVTNVTTTYSVTNLVPTSRIRARLNAALPAGVSIRVQLNAPAGGTSAGFVTLTTTDQIVVSNIPIGTHNNLTITYELIATSAAGVVPLGSRTVTLTLSAL